MLARCFCLHDISPNIAPLRSKAMVTEIPAKFFTILALSVKFSKCKQQYNVHYCFSKGL